MLKPHYFALLVSLLVDGGTTAPAPSDGADGGIVLPQPNTPDAPRPDGGTVVSQPPRPETDGGTDASQPVITDGIRWPNDLRPLAILDGPAILAAHAALQRTLARFPKEYAGACSYSAKALEVVVGQEEGLYFVRVNRRIDRCGRMTPGAKASLDWFELYAVSPEGRVLARYPYHP